MNVTQFRLVEDCNADWSKYFDPVLNCYFYYNKITEESTWTPPKKVLTESSWEYLPIDYFFGDEDTTAATDTVLSTAQSESSNEKCLKCDSCENILGHQYCEQCYEEINNHEEPLIAKYKIRCQKCLGWGLGLVQSNGCCKWCNYRVENGLPISSPPSWKIHFEEIVPEPLFPKCVSCKGWGKDLLGEGEEKCKHCVREEIREAFDKRWKPKCLMCKGYGLDLVGSNGLCNHCARLITKDSQFTREKISLDENSTIQPINELKHENQFLQKRKLESLNSDFKGESPFSILSQ